MSVDATDATVRGGDPLRPVVECSSLVRVYESPTGRVQAVRGADLTIESGRAVAIVGPSGSGKSSLLRMIAGLDDPTAGDVLIAGENITKMGVRARRELRARLLSHIYQRPSDNLIAHLTVGQQVERVARHRRVPLGDVDELLERLGLADRARHLPDELSGGEQQRAAFARAAIGRPALIIADEPTAELDGSNTSRVLATIDELTTDGITVLLATHDPLVLDHVHEVVTLRDGAIASVTDSGGELAVIDRAGRLQLPIEARAAFADRRARLTWDPSADTLRVERP